MNMPIRAVLALESGIANRARIRNPLRVVAGSDLSLILSAAVVVVLVLWGLVPTWFTSYAPTDMGFDAVLQPPSATHPFGTDHFGRDVYTLVIYGARQSLLVGFGVVTIGASIGGTLGLIIGYFGRGMDALVMRALEIWLAIPDILLVILIATTLEAGLTNLIVTMGIVSIPRYVRLMRSQSLAIKSRPFVMAARATGASHFSILYQRILPHAFSLLLVVLTLSLGTAMLTGAALSFIGLGVIEDRPDWGALLSEGRNYVTSGWWSTTFPGLAVTLVVVALNVLGEALRIRLDPHSQRR